LDYEDTTEPLNLDFGQTFAGRTVSVTLAATVAGDWNYDGDDSYFDDNWSIEVNGDEVARFFYGNTTVNDDPNLDINVVDTQAEYIFGQSTRNNDDFSIQQNITLSVELDENGAVQLDFIARSTSPDETLVITGASIVDQPATLVYQLDLGAELVGDTFDGSESLSVRITGVPDAARLVVTDAGQSQGLSVARVDGTQTVEGTWTWSFETNGASLEADGVLSLEIPQEGSPGDYTDPSFALSLVTVATEESPNADPFEAVGTPKVVTVTDGVVVDGVVEGLTYSTSSGIAGTTDVKGSFKYITGDAITFSVGNIVLGTFLADEVMADGKVFLQEIAGVGLENLTDNYVENMAVFLQSIDNDDNAYNGIVISEGIHDAFSDDSFDLATISKTGLNDVLEDNGYTAVDEDAAMVHVADMIREHAGLTEFEARPDAILATEGDDVFAFALSDTGEAPADVVISGFGESGADSLDVSDLLVGEDDGADLSAYLNVSFDGANTVIEVSSTGAFAEGLTNAAGVDQVITLEGVDLVGTDELSTVIQSMLDSGKLITD
jgi:hypothetical protein